MGNITVVGSYIVALVMDTDRIPLEGETVIGDNYHTTHGGKGSNMAACISRLNGNSTFMGKIGRDSFGESFLKLLKDEGVNNDGVLYSDKLPTAVGFIVSSSSGSNIIVIDIAANGEFSPEDIDENKSIIEQSDVILSPLEIPFNTAIHSAKLAKENGIKKNHIILDPGIGFGKSFEHNFTVIRRLNEICDLGYPVMIGPSRKAFIGDTLGLPLNERIEGTLATVVAGIMNGAKIVRVHDIKEVKRAVKVTEKILASA